MMLQLIYEDKKLRDRLVSWGISNEDIDRGLYLRYLIDFIDKSIFKYPRARVLFGRENDRTVVEYWPYFKLDHEKEEQENFFIYLSTLRLHIKRLIDEIQQYLDRENKLPSLTNEKILLWIACHEIRHRMQWNFFNKFQQFMPEHVKSLRCPVKIESIKMAISLYKHRKYELPNCQSFQNEFDAYVIGFLSLYQPKDSDSLTSENIRELLWSAP